MRLFYLTLLLGAVTACKTTKPLEPLDPSETGVAVTPATLMEMLTAKKIKHNTFIFAGGDVSHQGETKLKGSTLATNTQKAGDNATLGAVSQAGADESKTKGSSQSTATASNTGGQGAEVGGNAEATATNEKKTASTWMLWVGIAGFIGLSLWRKSLNPLQWFKST